MCVTGDFTDSDPWICCEHFTIADIYLATLLHRLVFTGQVKRFWGDGKRPYLAAYYDRVQRRKSFKHHVDGRITQFTARFCRYTGINYVKQCHVLWGSLWLLRWQCLPYTLDIKASQHGGLENLYLEPTPAHTHTQTPPTHPHTHTHTHNWVPKRHL